MDSHKLKEDLILSSLTLTRETERGAPFEIVNWRNRKLTTDGVGNKKQIY